MKSKNIVLILSSLFLLSGCNSSNVSSRESDSTFIYTEDSSKVTTTEVTTKTSTTSSQTSSTESTSSASISSYLDYYKVSVIENKDIEIVGLDSSYQEGAKVTFTISILNKNSSVHVRDRMFSSHRYFLCFFQSRLRMTTRFLTAISMNEFAFWKALPGVFQ